MKNSLLAITILCLSACGTLTVHNREVCADLGSVIYQGNLIGAQCAHTLTPANRTVLKSAWDIERVGWLCMDSQAYTDIETEIQQACVQSKCDYQTQLALNRALERIKSLSALADKARKHKKITDLGPKPKIIQD